VKMLTALFARSSCAYCLLHEKRMPSSSNPVQTEISNHAILHLFICISLKHANISHI